MCPAGSDPDEYRTIKALVLDYVHRTGGAVDYEALTAGVLRHFPGSRWQRTHWSWYRHQILRGRFKNQFSPDEMANLRLRGRGTGLGERPMGVRAARDDAGSPTQRGPGARDPEVKRPRRIDR